MSVGEAGGVSVNAVASVQADGEQPLLYEVTGVMMAAEDAEVPAWRWLDGNRDHIVVGPPNVDGETWSYVVGDSTVTIAAQ